MAGTLLTPPAEWGQDARSLPIAELPLLYYPRKPYDLPDGRTWEDVERDLERGAWLVRDHRSRFEAFRLGGREFELKVARHQSRSDTAVWLAAIAWVKPAQSVPSKAHRLRPARVRIMPISREIRCDLAALETRVAQRERRLNVSERRSPGADPKGSYGDLRRAVQREYGELQTMIDLLAEQPPEVEAELTGMVANSSRPGTIRVNASGDQPLGPFQRQRVEVTTPDGWTFHTQVSYVRRRSLEIGEPRKWRAAPGTEVTVRVESPFGMRQNAEALRHFWAENVEGSWDDLARLLCRPERLSPLPASRQALKFYCDNDPDPGVHSLNAEQRRAVSGAVLSPHAFFVQGPPGTGKTEVISEIIRQLTGRGERVLLLAPSHVAVDEALSRVGRKPGIRALRITFSDDKVQESERAFLPENAGLEAARQVFDVADDGQTERWAREREQVTEATRAYDELAAAEEHLERTADDLQAVHEEHSRLAAILETRRVSAEENLAFLERDTAEARQSQDECAVAAEAAATSEQRVLARLEPPLDRLRTAAVELIAAGNTALQAGRAEAQSLRRQTEREEAVYPARLRSAAGSRFQAEASHARASADANRAQAALSAAYSRLSAATPPRTRMSRVAARLGINSYLRLERELTAAHAEARAAEIDLDEKTTAVTVAVQEQQRTADEVATERVQLDRAARESTAARVAAAHAFAEAHETFAGVYSDAVPGLRYPAVQTRISDWIRLAEAVNTRISDVLPPGPLHRSSGASAERERAAPWEREWAEALSAMLEELLTPVFEARRTAERYQEARTRHRECEDLLRQAKIRAEEELRQLEPAVETASTARRERQAEWRHAVRERNELRERLQDAAYPDRETLDRRAHVLDRFPGLADRWSELTAERTDQQVVEDIQQSIIRATNLVCATTKGIVGWGSQLVRHADYDTLIVDEASRVTESEFLIGAVRARRWVLVGDEHQLSPYVETRDEQFLHALAALHRHASGRSESLEDAVTAIGGLWQEDEELRKFRDQAVLERAGQLAASGNWDEHFADQFADAYGRFVRNKKQRDDPDRALLAAMIRYLVRSLFERAATKVDGSLRQRLVWQRRMIAPLAQVVNGPVYHGEYQTPGEEELASAGVTPLITSSFNAPFVFLDTSRYADAGDTQDHHGFYNQREIDLVTKICQRYNTELKKHRIAEPVTASVLSFYSAQASRLRDALLPKDLPMLNWQVIDVIDRIQGQQSDLVIVSFTRAKQRGFGPDYGRWLMDLRRLNVACTRSRRALVLVGHGDTLQQLGGREPRDAQARRAREFYDNLFTLLKAGGPFLHRYSL